MNEMMKAFGLGLLLAIALWATGAHAKHEFAQRISQAEVESAPAPSMGVDRPVHVESVKGDRQDVNTFDERFGTWAPVQIVPEGSNEVVKGYTHFDPERN